MSYLYNQIGGIGKTRIVIGTTLGSILLDYTFPLAQQGGYFEQWHPEGFDTMLQNLDFTDPSLSETPYEIGHWGIWDLNFENNPMPIAVAEAIRDIRNNVGRAGVNNEVYIYPKYDSNPTRFFRVNVIREPFTLRNNDNKNSTGNYGLRIGFKTIVTHPYILIEPIIAPDSRRYVYGDDSFDEILYTV